MVRSTDLDPLLPLLRSSVLLLELGRRSGVSGRRPLTAVPGRRSPAGDDGMFDDHPPPMLPFVTDEFDRVGAMPELVLPGEFGVLVIIVGEDNSRLLLAGAGAAD